MTEGGVEGARAFTPPRDACCGFFVRGRLGLLLAQPALRPTNSSPLSFRRAYLDAYGGPGAPAL